MIGSMHHESFYDSGMYSAPGMSVYAGWLAHDNSFLSQQPFFNEQRDIVLLFSGDCFMLPAQQIELRKQGHETGPSAPSCLVHLYEERGDRFFQELNGLFSGLLVDKRQSKAFLFNDRYGVERIYSYEADGDIFFASEAKALLRVSPERRAFDEEGLTQFLTFGCTLGERTLFRDVHLVPGGSVWRFADGECHKQKYFSPEVWERQPILAAGDFEQTFRETFQGILPAYLDSASQVGISLTAGVDSRMMMACLPCTGPKPICYTFSGTHRDTLDARLGARVAEACGLEHQILRLGEDFFSQFASYVDKTIYATDGALGSLGAHEIYLNSRARALAPVRLTGVFGGEILRGVSMFKPLGLAHELFSAELAARITSCRSRWSHRNSHPITFAAFHEVPEQRFAVPAASRSQTGFRTPYLDNKIIALAYQAPEHVRSSTDLALCVIRANNPSLTRIPTDMGEMGGGTRLAAVSRRILSKAVCKLDYLRNEGLPKRFSMLDPVLSAFTSAMGLAGRHKYLHYRIWFQRELRGYVNEILENVQDRDTAVWNPRFLAQMTADYATTCQNYMHEIDAILTLEAVERLLFRDIARERSGSPAIEVACNT